uniref:hypothetical protein n=1 Tax=Borreliella garinii TaxID=29519 RepID=UPI00359C6BDE
PVPKKSFLSSSGNNKENFVFNPKCSLKTKGDSENKKLVKVEKRIKKNFLKIPLLTIPHILSIYIT